MPYVPPDNSHYIDAEKSKILRKVETSILCAQKTSILCTHLFFACRRNEVLSLRLINALLTFFLVGPFGLEPSVPWQMDLDQFFDLCSKPDFEGDEQ